MPQQCACHTLNQVGRAPTVRLPHAVPGRWAPRATDPLRIEELVHGSDEQRHCHEEHHDFDHDERSEQGALERLDRC